MTTPVALQKIDVSTPAIPLKEQVAKRLHAAVNQILKDILLSLANAQSLSPQQYIDTQITPKQAALSNLDERTRKFVQKVLPAVNIELDRMGYTLRFQVLAEERQDPQVQQKIVQGIALPTIQALIIDFDKMKTSIVDDIVGIHPPKKFSFKSLCALFSPVQTFFERFIGLIANFAITFFRSLKT